MTLNFRLATFLVIIIAGFLAILWLSVTGLKTALFEQKKQQSRYLVENTHSLLAYLHELSSSGMLTEQQAKQRAIDTVQALRYDQNNYFWINDKQPVLISHPYNKELIGKDLSQIQDANGKYLFNEFIAVANTLGEGTVTYLWPKPGKSAPIGKVSYIKLFAPWDWIIGSGVYIDDVEEAFWGSARLIGIISTSMLLLVVTAILIIRREASFQQKQYLLIEDANARLEQQVSERTAALQQANSSLNSSHNQAINEKQKLENSEAIFRGMAETAQDAIILIDAGARLVYWNASAERIFGYSASEALDKELHTLITMSSPKEPQQGPLQEPRQEPLSNVLANLVNAEFRSTQGQVLELTARRKSGTLFPVELAINAIRIDDTWQTLGIIRDISDRKAAERNLINRSQRQAELIKQLQDTQEQLLQSEKLASIGQLSAGVAHEINNPVGFIASNINTASGYIDQLIAMQESIKTKTTALDNSEESQRIIAEVEQQYEFAYLKQDLSDLFVETKDGIRRIQKIVADLKGFARASDGAWESIDLHKEIDSTLNVIWNELKYHCTIEKQYGDLPSIECLRSEINQVIMNLLINASHAIEDKGVIRISTGADQTHAWVAIEDTGKGINPEILHRIFDPFFTTKPVGKGTGLGLSVSYGIIDKHNGKLEVISTPGVGSTFTMTLPLHRVIT